MLPRLLVSSVGPCGLALGFWPLGGVGCSVLPSRRRKQTRSEAADASHGSEGGRHVRRDLQIVANRRPVTGPKAMVWVTGLVRTLDSRSYITSREGRLGIARDALITRRPGVRIPPPLPKHLSKALPQGGLSSYPNLHTHCAPSGCIARTGIARTRQSSLTRTQARNAIQCGA